MSAPVLVGVAHGSRDAAARHTVAALLDGVRAELPEASVRPAFVRHAEPSLERVLADVGPHAVVVPLLLSRGYHVVDDVERLARRSAVVARSLGPDPLLCDVLLDRLAETGAPDGTPIVLGVAGSRDPRAAADVREQAALLRQRTSVPVVVAYAAAGRPTLDEAVTGVLRTGRPAVLLPYLLSPGHFFDRMLASTATWVAAPLGGHPVVASLVARRYREATSQAVPA